MRKPLVDRNSRSKSNTLGEMRDFPSALVLGYGLSYYSDHIVLLSFCPLQYPMYLMVRDAGLEPARHHCQQIFLLLYVTIANKVFLSNHVLVTISYLDNSKTLTCVFLLLQSGLCLHHIKQKRVFKDFFPFWCNIFYYHR